MSTTKCSIDDLADVINEKLSEYASLTTEEMKSAVRSSANLVRKEIKANAPVGNTGRYKASWATKTMSETSNSLNITVYSKDRYQLAHLLEKGHALRNGGRTSAQPHIAPAEEAGIAKLESEIKKALS